MHQESLFEPEGRGTSTPPRAGFTAMEAAEALIADPAQWRRRETIRRRVQELENPYWLLEVVGERENSASKAENQVYAITALGLEALRSWHNGLSWTPLHLARSDDPATSQKATRNIRPHGDFHRVLSFYAGIGQVKHEESFIQYQESLIPMIAGVGKAVLAGGWLDGREFLDEGKLYVQTLDAGVIPWEGAVFLVSDGETLRGQMNVLRYTRTTRRDTRDRVIYLLTR